MHYFKRHCCLSQCTQECHEMSLTFLCNQFFLSFELNLVPRYNPFSWNSFLHLQILLADRLCSFPKFYCFHLKSLDRKHQSLTNLKKLKWIKSIVELLYSRHVNNGETREKLSFTWQTSFSNCENSKDSGTNRKTEIWISNKDLISVLQQDFILFGEKIRAFEYWT